MTLTALKERLVYWQDRLNLPEWSIKVQWGAGKGCVGSCRWHAEELTATVSIQRGCPDEEGTLLHELLHIVLQGHEPCGEAYSIQTERAINRLTAAFQRES